MNLADTFKEAAMALGLLLLLIAAVFSALTALYCRLFKKDTKRAFRAIGRAIRLFIYDCGQALAIGSKVWATGIAESLPLVLGGALLASPAAGLVIAVMWIGAQINADDWVVVSMALPIFTLAIQYIFIVVNELECSLALRWSGHLQVFIPLTTLTFVVCNIMKSMPEGLRFGASPERVFYVGFAVELALIARDWIPLVHEYRRMFEPPEELRNNDDSKPETPASHDDRRIDDDTDSLQGADEPGTEMRTPGAGDAKASGPPVDARS